MTQFDTNMKAVTVRQLMDLHIFKKSERADLTAWSCIRLCGKRLISLLSLKAGSLCSLSDT